MSEGRKWWVKGVTYGTFRPRQAGQREEYYPEPRKVASDFTRMAANGINSVRTYTVPPRWLLDLASEHGLRVMIGLPWEQHVAFLDDARRARDIVARVSEGVRACAGHPAVLAYAIGNEIPASIVRWHGRRAIERFLTRLYLTAKDLDPEALCTYVNFPTTEYLDLPFLELVCFNVYLESQAPLQAYLARIHNLAGDRPLILAELGLDSRRHGEAGQAHSLEWQLRSAFTAGCAGAFVFSWTDEWYRGGYDIEDWDFGLTRRDRQSKPALNVVRRVFDDVPCIPQQACPRISVVVCSYNGARTIRDCLEGLRRVQYPNYEVIVVDDGSTDETARIAASYPFRLIRTENRGLSSARNIGMKEATGEIVAYIDDDAWPDPHWLTYLAETFLRTEHAGVGGPNIPPPDTAVAECVANAPGGPVHVLLADQVAEHIPGCNMAFRKSCMEAIGGFDTQFRSAGDDVDLCWRLQERRWTLGFNAAAVVWHRRRHTVNGYWRQQRGYGRAEALLEAKWPEKYRPSGGATWGGRIYGKGLLPTLACRTRIYHGVWGTAPFQSLCRPSPRLVQSIPLMPEWYLLVLGAGLLSLLGPLWWPLALALPVFAGMLAVTMGQAVAGAQQAIFSNQHAERGRLHRWGLKATTTGLFLMQPLARLYGRISSGLTPWRCRVRMAPVLPLPCTLRFWSERGKEAHQLLQSVERVVRAHRTVVSRGGEYDRWDLEVRAGLFGTVRLLMGLEEHGAGKQLIRFRLRPRCARFAIVVAAAFTMASAAAALEGAIAAGSVLLTTAIWPFGRTVWECGLAMAAVRQSLRQLWPDGALEQRKA
jgi:GT2 family glycosyltransferase